MAAGRPGLTEEQTETLTDLMVMKLSMIRAMYGDEGGVARDPSKLNRDEIMLVIVDTEILLCSDDIGATLDRWKETA